MRVFVLLFNAGTDNEGIHTLKIGDRNIVLMFEQQDDAERYALMLEAQDFGNPSVECFEREDIEEFCTGAGYTCKVVHEGALELPPEANVDTPDWQPGQDPKAVPNPDSDFADIAAEQDEYELSPAELDRIRRQLEGLI
jgi:hypothetical protein